MNVIQKIFCSLFLLLFVVGCSEATNCTQETEEIVLLNMVADIELLKYVNNNFNSNEMLVERIEHKIIDDLILVLGFQSDINTIPGIIIHPLSYLIEYNNTKGLDKMNKHASKVLAVNYLSIIENKVKVRINRETNISRDIF